MTQRPQGPQTTGEATAVAPQTESADRLTTLIHEAKARIEAADLEGGVMAFRRIAEEYPSIPEVFNNLGAICAAMGRRDEAEAAFTRATSLQPDAPNPWYNRGLMRFQGGNYSGALDDFERAAALDPEDPVFLNNQGVTLYQMREFDRARAAFQSAVDLQPDYVAACLNLVDVDLAQGALDEALTAIRALAEDDPTPEVLEKTAECSVYVALRALDDAQNACEAGLAQQSDNETILAHSSRVLRAKQALLGEDSVAQGAASFSL